MSNIDLCPATLKIILKMMTISPNSSYVERMFSQMKAIKTQLRNRLSDGLLEKLVKIKMGGPSKEDFDYKIFCKKHFNKL